MLNCKSERCFCLMLTNIFATFTFIITNNLKNFHQFKQDLILCKTFNEDLTVNRNQNRSNDYNSDQMNS